MLKSEKRERQYTPMGDPIPFPEEMCARRLAAARQQSKWIEYRADALRRVAGKYWADDEGRLFERNTDQVFAAGDPQHLFNEHTVSAFFEDSDGEPVLLKNASAFPTVAALENHRAEKEAARERAEREKFRAEQKRLDYLRSQPTRVLTLGDMMRRNLPPLREAVETILAVGSLEVHASQLVIRVPEKLTQGRDNSKREAAALDGLADAALTILGARDIVVKALESDSRKPLAERLPNVHVSADGGMAA